MPSTLLPAVALALQLPLSAQVAPTTPSTPDIDAPGAGETELPAAEDQRERAVLLLSGYHGIPTAEEFEAALLDAPATIYALATDPDVSPIHRDRALGALAYWPDDRLRTLYVGLLDDPETPEMVRHRVIGHVAVAFEGEAVELVAPYLDDDDLQFRLTAVHALRTIGTPAALQHIEAAIAAEQSTVVIEEMTEALRQIR